MRRYELSDHEWSRIEEYFEKKEAGTPGRPPRDPREMLNAIVWLARSGAPWRDLPERFGPWETVYSKFRKWLSENLLEKIFDALKIDADMETLCIDSTSVRVHQHAAGAKKGANPLKSVDHVAD
jgi:transposase